MMSAATVVGALLGVASVVFWIWLVADRFRRRDHYDVVERKAALTDEELASGEWESEGEVSGWGTGATYWARRAPLKDK